MNYPDISAVASEKVDLAAVQLQQFLLEDVAYGLTEDQKLYVLRRMELNNLENWDDLPLAATFMLDKVAKMDSNEAVEVLRGFVREHEDDLMLEELVRALAKQLVEEADGETGVSKRSEESAELAELSEKRPELAEIRGKQHPAESLASADADWELQAKTEAALVAFWLPYPEVRAVTQPYDDENLPCETWRAYLLGVVWLVIGCIINQYFLNRQPLITLLSSVVQLFLYPCGKLLDRLPRYRFRVFGYEVDTNPGPWSSKEQMLATLCFSVSGGLNFLTYFIMILRMQRFYGVQWVDFGWEVLLTLGVNFLGFGLAGIFRRFLVYPVQAVWPTIMPTLALNRALTVPEKKLTVHGWSMLRYTFYFVVTAISFVWFWVPDYLFTALSTFNWILWIKPDNLNLATVTGSQTGLGFNPITTFDWNIIEMSTPLSIPWFAQINQYAGAVVLAFVILGLWYSNYKWLGFLPINLNQVFANTGQPYDVQEILNGDNVLDPEKYAKVGPPFYTASNMVTYGAFFAVYPLVVTWVALLNWRQIKFAFGSVWRMLKQRKLLSSYDGFDDPFSRSMAKYKEVPEWVYTIILVVFLVLAIVMIKIYPMGTPVWTVFFVIGINFVFLLPAGLVYAFTGSSLQLNVVVELIAGYALPGNGIAMTTVKILGTMLDSQADNYITNQKQAHYLRIPPRALFRIQMLSMLITTFVCLGVLHLTLDTIADYCDPRNPLKMTCPSATTYYSLSVLWGVIGPKRVFGSLYPVMQWCFLIGFLAAFPAFLVFRFVGAKYPKVRYFHPVVFVSGFLIWAPYNLSYYTPGIIVGYFFMSYIRKRYLAWWERYNYVLSGALSAGVAFSSIIIYFAVQYHPKYISWWGNNVNDYGLDAIGPARLNVTEQAPDGYFGPRVGHFP